MADRNAGEGLDRKRRALVLDGDLGGRVPRVGDEGGETVPRHHGIHVCREVLAAHGLFVVNGRLAGVDAGHGADVAALIARALFDDAAVAVDDRVQISRTLDAA